MSSLVGLSACQSGAGPEPATHAASPPVETYEEEDLSAEEADLLAQIESEAALAEEEAHPLPADSAEDEGAREIVYRLSRDGLRVQIGDAEFTPYAVAFRTAGGWGIRLTVEAKSESEAVLFAPKQGPLAFGGFVKRGKAEKFGDRREGGSEVALTPGQPVSFSRTWPDPGEPGLRPGEEVELHVGLWGFGATSETRRPVTRFAVVRMKASGTEPKPVIEPPAQ